MNEVSEMKGPGPRALAVILGVLCGLASLFMAEREAAAEWDYRNGFGVEGDNAELRLNVFARPYYQYMRDASEEDRSTFGVDLAGGRLRVRVPRRRILLEVTGGVREDEGVLLDTFLDLGIGDALALRMGYFRVPFDEQTTHAPFWLRMTQRSIDVQSLAHYYDVGIALRGNHLDNSLVWSLSMTNGETDWENANIDFLYSLRVALRLGPLLDWGRSMDLVIGLGSSWNLKPWSPEETRPELEVNRSVFNETLDLTWRMSWFTVSAAGFFRADDLGAYGPNEYSWGWHGLLGASLGSVLEFATRVAHVIPDAGPQQLEIAAVVNGFADDGRLRFQLEYTYLAPLDDGEIEGDSHRVVVLLQAFY